MVEYVQCKNPPVAVSCRTPASCTIVVRSGLQEYIRAFYAGMSCVMAALREPVLQ